MPWNNPTRKNGAFVNPHVNDHKRGLFDLILWRIGYYNEDQLTEPPPHGFFYPAKALQCDKAKPYAMWLGHSTYLVSVNGLTILTDPVFSEHCSPVPIRKLRRQHDVPFEIEDLPQIDMVLISHNHYDHLDRRSVKKLSKLYPDATWIVPTGVKRWFEKRGIRRAVELEWGQSALVEGAKIHAVPAQHFSGRSLWDKNKTLWCGYVVEQRDKTFYFVGDTGYNAVDFKAIGKLWKPDLSLIPIGTYIPKEFMKPVHISPYDAVEIHKDVGSKLSLGMHWKTFVLSDEPVNRPPYDLYLAMKESNLPFETFLPVEPGEHVNW